MVVEPVDGNVLNRGCSACRVPQTVRICRWEVKVTPLWLWWYCIMVLVMEGYLMYRAVTLCRQYNELQWKTDDKPVVELYVYIILIVISVMCMPFFVITSIFKVGSYANDGTRFGRDDKLDSWCQDADRGEGKENRRRGSSNLQTLWRHLGPLNNGFHIMAAFALLLPSVLIQAQRINHGFSSPDGIWESELDILFGRNTIRRDAAIYTFFSQSDNTTKTSIAPLTMEIEHVTGVSPEFLNYIVALIIYSVRYAAVFWYTKLAFSMLFSLYLMVCTANYMFSFCGMAVLYKFEVNDRAVENMDLLLPASVTIILYIAANTVMFFSALAIFNYGFYQYSESFKRFLKTNFPDISSSFEKTPSGCEGYIPHTIAGISLLAIVGCRGPIIYDYVIAYRRTGFTILLASILMDICNMVVWLVLWFIFTVKHTWDFKVGPKLSSEERDNVYSITGEHNDSTVPPLISQPRPVSNGGSAIPRDTTDLETTPPSPALSPASVLRKSGEKRHTQRVTFDDAVPEQTKDTRGSQKKKKKEEKSKKKKKRNGSQDDSDCVSRRPHVLDEYRTRPLSDSYLDRGGNLEGYMRGGTPENTLTRNYRHSIRDKCGQYYRPSKDFNGPPPAAQSSPVLRERPRGRIQDPGFDSPDVETGKDIPYVRNHRDMSPVRQPRGRNQSPTRARQKSPVRAPFGPPRPEQTLPSYDDYLSGGACPPYPGRKLHDPDIKLSQLSLPDEIPSRQQELDDCYYGQGARPKNSPRVPIQSLRNKDLNRELRILTKPELNRRDSALPSSNETSSNESGENVLCSQV